MVTEFDRFEHVTLGTKLTETIKCTSCFRLHGTCHALCTSLSIIAICPKTIVTGLIFSPTGNQITWRKLMKMQSANTLPPDCFALQFFAIMSSRACALTCPLTSRRFIWKPQELLSNCTQ